MNQQDVDNVVKTLNNRLIPAFCEHLEQCSRCRENPFDLCDVGAGLLKLAATGIPQMVVTESSRQT